MKSRFAAIAALLLSLSLFGCTQARLHILIPDFALTSVDGLRVYRVLSGGSLQLAGRITFNALRSTAQGLELEYTQVVPDYGSYGPLVARATRPRPAQLEIEMVVYNPGDSGRFRFASYNETGTSRATEESLYVAGGQQPQ